MDDLLVFGTSKRKHDESLDAVLKKFSAAGVMLNRAKCSFGVREAAFLGFVFDQTGIKQDTAKEQAIK